MDRNRRWRPVTDCVAAKIFHFIRIEREWVKRNDRTSEQMTRVANSKSLKKKKINKHRKRNKVINVFAYDDGCVMQLNFMLNNWYKLSCTLCVTTRRECPGKRRNEATRKKHWTVSPSANDVDSVAMVFFYFFFSLFVVVAAFIALFSISHLIVYFKFVGRNETYSTRWHLSLPRTKKKTENTKLDA